MGSCQYPKGAIRRGNFSCNLQRNTVARQVEVETARGTPSAQPVSQGIIGLRGARNVD